MRRPGIKGCARLSLPDIARQPVGGRQIVLADGLPQFDGERIIEVGLTQPQKCRKRLVSPAFSDADGYA
jgi:hypothetical protein